MPNIKKYSTGRIGNRWPKHENTDHINTKGLDKNNQPGIEAFIDEDIVRAYDDNRPLINLLSNDEILSYSEDSIIKERSVNVYYKNQKEDWTVKVEDISLNNDPEDFSKRFEVTPLKVNVGVGATKSDGIIAGTAKRLVGLKRDDGTIFWIDEQPFFYNKAPIIDDINASYNGYYRPIYTDTSESALPSDFNNYRLKVRQRYTTGAIYEFPFYSKEEYLIPYSTSIVNINNEVVNFSNSEYPYYNNYPNSYAKLGNVSYGNLELSIDTKIKKILTRESYKIPASNFIAESGVFKASLRSDVFRESKESIINRIESDNNFIRVIGGVKAYNNTSKVFFKDHKNVANVLTPLRNNFNFLGDSEYSFILKIGDSEEKVVTITSPETRGYSDIIVNSLNPYNLVVGTPGNTTCNFRIKVNNDNDFVVVEFTINNPNLFDLVNAINNSFESNNIFAEATIQKSGIYYNIRVFSKSSGSYSKIEIQPGTSDLAQIIGGSYGLPVSGIDYWYIYYNENQQNPETPLPDHYIARCVNGFITRNDFSTGPEGEKTIGYKLFNAIRNAGFTDFTVGVNTNTDDNHTCELYIASNNTTNGFIDLNMSIQDPTQDSGLEPLKTYYFKLNIDKTGFVEYSFTTTTDVSYGGVIRAINSVLNNRARFVIEPTGKVIIYSDSFGPNSYIETSDGTTGTNLFGAAYPAAGFTPVSEHRTPKYGEGDLIEVKPRVYKSLTIFKDITNKKRIVFSYDDSKLYVVPHNETKILDYIETEVSYLSRNVVDTTYLRYSTHNDKVIVIDFSAHQNWAPNAIITKLYTLKTNNEEYLLIGNSVGQVYFIKNNKNLYNKYILLSDFVLLTDNSFNSVINENTNNFFLFEDQQNNVKFLFVLFDKKILFTDVTNGLQSNTSFDIIDTTSVGAVPNITAPVFSKILDCSDWSVNVTPTISNTYLVFVGKSDSLSQWDKAPILYALYNTSSRTFTWYAEEKYRKTQIDDITSIVRYDGWQDPQQASQLFIASNINGPELLTVNSQNSNLDFSTPGDDRFTRFSWIETNWEKGDNSLNIDFKESRINFLKVFNNKIFIGTTRENDSEVGGLYSFALNKLQPYYKVDTYNCFYDDQDDLLYIITKEGDGANSDPSILKISKEREEGRAQVFSFRSLRTVSNWPLDSAFRIVLNGFIVGGVNYDGEYNVKFNGQNKTNIFEIVDAINGNDLNVEGFKKAIDVRTGIISDLSGVVRARALINRIKQGNTYVPEYKIVIESKIPTDPDASHSSLQEETNSNASIKILFPTIGTSVVGTGNDTMEILDGTIGYASIRAIDWSQAEAYQIRRVRTPQISFSTNTFINITPYVTQGYEILAGSIRVKTNENNEYGYIQGKGRILKPTTQINLNPNLTYAFKVIFDEGLGYSGQKSIIEVITVGDVNGSLDGKYWQMSSSLYDNHINDFYVWYNVDKNSVDPNILNRRGIEVIIKKNDDANTVARKTAKAINKVYGFIATVVGNTITIENKSHGTTPGPSPQTSGFTINIIQLGSPPLFEKLNWVVLNGGSITTIQQLVDAINNQLINGVCSLQTLGQTSEYIDLVITSNSFGTVSTVRIERDKSGYYEDLFGINGLNVIPNKPIPGSSILSTKGSQTFGFTWENIDYFYIPSHPDNGQKRIYISSVGTRIDPGSTVWVDFWQYKKLTKISAKNQLGENNLPTTGQWTYDLEAKKIVIGEEPKKTHPQDFIYVDIKYEKDLIKLDLGDNIPIDKEQLANEFSVTSPYNLLNSDLAVARSVSKVIPLHYGAKLFASNTENNITANYSYFLPRLDVLSAKKELNSFGNKTQIIKGEIHSEIPYIELPLNNQDKELYTQAIFVRSTDYNKNNIVDIPYYNNEYLLDNKIFLKDGRIHYFKNNLISTRGLKPLNKSSRDVKKVLESIKYSLVRVKDPINTDEPRKRNGILKTIDATNTIYVDVISGNNINDGFTRYSGLATLQEAVNRCTSIRNNIIILKRPDHQKIVFPALIINRSFPINIVAEDSVRILGLTLNSDVYLEGIEIAGKTTPTMDARLTLQPNHKLKAKYCVFNWIETQSYGLFSNGLNIEISNSTFLLDGIIIKDNNSNTLRFAKPFEVVLNNVYFKKAKIVEFFPFNYDTSKTNKFIFNNITNGLGEEGYIINTNKSVSLQFEFNNSLLISSDITKFASSAPIILNKCITYITSNNESYGTGSIVSNNSVIVNPGDADIIKDIGAPVSIARGFEKDSKAIGFVDRLYDAGAFIEERFEYYTKNDERNASEETFLLFKNNRSQYRLDFDPEKITLYLRFKPINDFQEQGVLFDSRYDGDYIKDTSSFNANGLDFFQIVYDNKSYGASYVDPSKYSFKLILSNSRATYVAIIGPEFSSENKHEFNYWHELAIQIVNKDTQNPKYEYANLSDGLDSNRKQTIIYVLFDRNLDKIYAPKTKLYEDYGGNLIFGSNWYPGKVLSTHFNIGGGWISSWVSGAGSNYWSTWSESNFDMIVDEYLVASEIIPLNVLASFKEKKVVDLLETNYDKTISDDKNTLILNHCNNPHPFSENSIEPFDDYYVSFRQYEGYDDHAIAIERVSQNLIPHGKIDYGHWYDRSKSVLLNEESLDLLSFSYIEENKSFIILANDSLNNFNAYIYINNSLQNILNITNNDKALSAKIIHFDNKFAVIYIKNSDNKIYLRTITKNDYILSSEYIINNAASSMLAVDRAHINDSIVIAYKEDINYYAQIVRVTDGTILYGRTEIRAGYNIDLYEISVSKIKTKSKEDAYLFVVGCFTTRLKYIIFDSELNNILFSLTDLSLSQLPNNLKTIVLPNNSILVKWRTPVSGGGANLKISIIDSDGAILVPEKNILTGIKGNGLTDDIVVAKDGNILIAGSTFTTNKIIYKLYSQSGDELTTSNSLRDYDLHQVTKNILLTIDPTSDDILNVFATNTQTRLTILDATVPVGWYKDDYGVYDYYLAEIFPTKTYFGNALHMIVNHTTSSGETGVFVADAETNNLSQFNSVGLVNGLIEANPYAAIHGNYGFLFEYNGDGSVLYAEKTDIISSSTENFWHGRFYFKVDSDFSILGSYQKSIEIARFGNFGDPLILEIIYNDPANGGDGKYKLSVKSNLFVPHVTINSVIRYNYNHFIEVKWIRDLTHGGFEVYVDGVKVLQSAPTNTYNVGVANYFCIGSKTSYTNIPSNGSKLIYDDIRFDDYYIGPYVAGLGQGDVWTKAVISDNSSKHYISGYYYIVSGNFVLELDGPALNEKISIKFSNNNYEHLSKAVDSVTDIDIEPINFNRATRFEVGFIPDNIGDINVHLKSNLSDENEIVDEFLVDNIKLEKNSFSTSIDAESLGYIAYPVSLKNVGSAYIRFKPEFKFDTDQKHTIFQGTNIKENGQNYTTHELYYDPINDNFKFELIDESDNKITVETDKFGPKTTNEKNLLTNLNDFHSIAVNWDADNGFCEIYLDGRWYKSTGNLTNFKNSILLFFGNREDRSAVSDCLFDLIRISEEQQTRSQVELIDGKIDPFFRLNTLNTGSTTVKSISIYGLNESDKATIYGEKVGEQSRLVLEVSDDFDDSVVIRHYGKDLAIFGSGGLTVNGTLNASMLTVKATSTITTYDDHITIRYGFAGTPPYYNDGYIEVERGDLTNSEIRFDESQDSWVFHDGTNNSISIDGTHIGTWKNNDNFNLVVNGIGIITLSTNSSTGNLMGDGSANRTDGTERVRVSIQETVINHIGFIHNFRVAASAGNTERVKSSDHLIFANSVNKQVLIGRESTFVSDNIINPTGSLVVNWKETIQSANDTSFGVLEFRNDSGTIAGWIGGGNGSNTWNINSEINTLSVNAFNLTVDLNSPNVDSFRLTTAGGIYLRSNGLSTRLEVDVRSVASDAILFRSSGGAQFYINGTQEDSIFRVNILGGSHESFLTTTNGGVVFNVNGTTSTPGQEDRFRVNISNNVADSFLVSTNGGAVFNVTEGFRVNENTNNSYYEISTTGKHTINTSNTANDSVLVNTTGGIQLTSNGQFNVLSNTGIFINEDSGSKYEIMADGVINIYAVKGINIIENSGTAISISDNGVLMLASKSNSWISQDVDGKIYIESADAANSHITIRARNISDIILQALNSNIKLQSTINLLNNAQFLVKNVNNDETIIAGYQNDRVELYFDNVLRLSTTNVGVSVNNILQVGTAISGSQGVFQAAGSFNNAGFINTPWIYTAAIEANERVSGSTGIFMNDGSVSTIQDEIRFVTNGQTALTINPSRNLIASNNLTINGSLNFSVGVSVNEIANSVVSSSATKLLTENAIVVFVNERFGNTSTTNSTLYWQMDPRLTTTNSGVDVGYTTKNSNTVLRVLSNDSNNAGLEAYGASQGTGYVYVGESSAFGGGIFYNGDLVPSFANGEIQDALCIYRRDNNVNTTVAYIRYNDSDLRLRAGLRFDDSTTARMYRSTNVSGHVGTSSNEGIVVEGSFSAFKVYNAVWNDYAESFEYDISSGEIPEPGYVYVQTKLGLRKANKRAHKATVGIYSDTYGMLLGSKGTKGEVENWNKIPIALAGVVNAWTKSKIKIGDLLVSDKNGMVTKANIIDYLFRNKRIVGIALEDNHNGDERKIKVKVC